MPYRGGCNWGGDDMRRRGIAYAAWEDIRPVALRYDEDFGSGLALEVRVRASATGATQLFIGLYNSEHPRPFEEYYPCLIGKTIDHALSLGILRGRRLAIGVADESFPTAGLITS